MAAVKKGRIVGEVTVREGDGVAYTIPKGPCEIQLTEVDATISWTDGDTRGVSAVPLAEYTRLVKLGAIVLDD